MTTTKAPYLQQELPNERLFMLSTQILLLFSLFFCSRSFYFMLKETQLWT
uniref:Uncharacterized protein n=1 Tax=Arundo donax TaxID=35708 RepID=A0A0A9I1K6_ARUDO